MTFPMDYHIHSKFSPDSQSELEDICQRAIDLGIKEICITDHFDLNPVSRSEYSLDPVEYLGEINSCREKFSGRLAVRCGLELGEPGLYQNELGVLTSKYPFDYLLGSVHWLGDELIGPDYLSTRRFEQACSEYLGYVYTTVDQGNFNCLGHLDMVKRHSTHYYQRNFCYQEFYAQVDMILNRLIERSMGLEINTSGWRQGVGEPYPGLEVLKRYRCLGGEIVTLGSDSHRIQQVGSGIAAGLELMKEAGLNYLTLFQEGKPTWISI